MVMRSKLINSSWQQEARCLQPCSIPTWRRKIWTASTSQASPRILSSSFFASSIRTKWSSQRPMQMLFSLPPISIYLLKSKCEEFIVKRLSIENCIEMMILADLHNAIFLKMMTQVLFCSRHTEIRKTEKWKAMKKFHADVAVDVLERLLELHKLWFDCHGYGTVRSFSPLLKSWKCFPYFLFFCFLLHRNKFPFLQLKIGLRKKKKIYKNWTDSPLLKFIKAAQSTHK